MFQMASDKGQQILRNGWHACLYSSQMSLHSHKHLLHGLKSYTYYEVFG